MPGFVRADCHGDGTPIRSGASGKKAAADVPPGVSRYRLSRLICRRPTSAVSGNREPACPACRALHSGTGSTGTHWPGPRLRLSVGRRVSGCGAQSEYIKVRSVVDDRAGSASAQQVAATGPQVPQARSAERSGLPSRCRASADASKPASRGRLPSVWSSVIGRSRSRGAGTRGSRRCEPARRGRRRTASRSAWSMPGGVVLKPAVTANSQRPAYAASSLSCRTRPGRGR